MLRSRSIVWMFSAGLMGAGAGVVSGQPYPNKPIRYVTSVAGGGADFTARIIAQGISAPLGQPVIVENRVNVLAIDVVMKASPDGYTLLQAASTFVYAPLLRETSYDPVRDFSPIARVTSTPNIIFLHPSVPVKSVNELISLAKAKPGALSYASTGIGSSSHLATELFKSMAGVNILHIPYKGNAQALIDVLSGQVQLLFSTLASIGANMRLGKVKALAVASALPSALTPRLPTVAATGLPGYESGQSNNVYAPANTSATIISRVNQEIVRFLNRTEVKEQFLQAGQETIGGSPADLARDTKSDIARMGKVIRDAGIRGGAE